MTSLQKSLIDGLPTGHLVRVWWENRWNSQVDFAWPQRPEPHALDAVMKQEDEGRVDRAVLMDVLRRQYAEAGVAEPTCLEALARPDARTVTTGHQLCLATGPAFTVYKALTALRLARHLELRWGTPVIPVFWLASEDHDFEEISSLWDGANWHRWSSEASGGAVGRMSAEGAVDTLATWGPAAGVNAEQVGRLVSSCSGSLSGAMRRWVHDALGQDLVVIDGDDSQLKAAFADRMVQEIREGTLHAEVNRVNGALESEGHAPQVHVRETNLFHLGENGRHRLVKQGERWAAGNAAWESTDALVDSVRLNPADFSPNALFRPLYQAFLLPDVAVVGGLAEVAYWLQLSTAHAAFHLPAPALVPRDGARIAPRPWMERAEQMGIGSDNLGGSIEEWEAHWLSRQDVPDVEGWRKAMDREADRARMEFSEVDMTLSGSVQAARAKMDKLLDKLEGQGRRAVRRQHAHELAELTQLHGWFHPHGVAQERTVNVHALSASWTGRDSLMVMLKRSFLEGHRGEVWSPVVHELLDTGP